VKKWKQNVFVCRVGEQLVIRDLGGEDDRGFFVTNYAHFAKAIVDAGVEGELGRFVEFEATEPGETIEREAEGREATVVIAEYDREKAAHAN
jgi:hypothetical protein